MGNAQFSSRAILTSHPHFLRSLSFRDQCRPCNRLTLGVGSGMTMTSRSPDSAGDGGVDPSDVSPRIGFELASVFWGNKCGNAFFVTFVDVPHAHTGKRCLPLRLWFDTAWAIPARSIGV